jgi:hypothetical protein
MAGEEYPPTADTRPPRAATPLRQSRVLGWLLLICGWPVQGLGVLTGGAAYTQIRDGAGTHPIGGLTGWHHQVLIAALLAVMSVTLWAGSRMRRHARRHLVKVLHSLDGFVADEKFVVFLRAFADDRGFAGFQAENERAPWATSTRTEEEQLARAVAPFGRMVALGRPGDPLPEPGAARHFSSDEHWRAQVRAGLEKANLVLLAAGPGKSLQWEVSQVVACDDPTRLVLIVSRSAEQYETFRTSMGELFPKGLPDYPPDPSWPRISDLHEVSQSAYTRAAIWFDADWTPHLEFLGVEGGNINKWVESTFPQAIRHVYERAGVPRPGRWRHRSPRHTSGQSPSADRSI